MLLAENLLRHGDFTLDRYNLPDPDYRIRNIHGHQYYYFPPGSSVLAVPYVALMDLRGVSAVRLDGTYSLAGERTLDASLAAGLMAIFTGVAYLTSRLILPMGWSVIVACVSSLGTQVLSTASRSMWSDTWGILLVGLAVFLLLHEAVRKVPSNVYLIGSLEGMAYIVRPTNSIVVIGTALYIVFTNRQAIYRFVVAVGAWFVLLFVYSWYHFRQFLPDYFVASRLQFGTPLISLVGNLASPSRGLLIYVPALIGFLLLLVRHRQRVRFRALAGLSALVVVGQLLVLSGFEHWWGGHSYGARLTTGVVPWVTLVGILAMDAFRTSCGMRAHGLADASIGIGAGLLGAASIIVNMIGACSREADKWNTTPDDIDLDPGRLWSWRRPQFMSPFIEPAGPFLALPGDGLRLGSSDADKYLGLGWADGEGEFRWTEGSGDSTVRFVLPSEREGALELDLRPFLVAGRLLQQRLVVSMNGHDIIALTVRSSEFTTYRIIVPAEVVRQDNILRLRHQDAASPAAFPGGFDRRVLGVAVRSVRWRESGLMEGT